MGKLALAATLALALAGPGAATSRSADYLLAANRDLERGDGIAAEMRLRKALEAGAPNEDVAALMGEAYLVQDEPRKAREWLLPARFAPVSAARGFRALARLHGLEGELAAAGEAFNRAIALTPRDATMWVEIGRLRYAGGEHLLAIEAADYALELDPRNVRALQFRGQIERDRTGLVSALPWFERALANEPADLSVLNDKAATLGELGRAREMLRVTRRMLELDPGNPDAFFLQAVLAARAGKAELARGLLNRTGDKLAEMPAAMLLRGALELRAGNYRLAAEALGRLVRLQPGNDRARLLLARAQFLSGDYRLLLRDFGEAAGWPETSPYLLTLLGRAQEMLGRRDLAAPLLDRAALATAPALAPVRQGSAIGALLSAGDLAGAEAEAEAARAAAPGNADNQVIAGDVQLALGRPAAALERYRVAAGVRRPESLMLRMAEAHARNGDGSAAASLMEDYLTEHPGSRDAMWLTARTSRADLASFLLGHVARAGKRDVRLLVEFARAELAAGDPQAAERTASAAYRLQRGSRTASEAWAESLAATGRNPSLARALQIKSRALGGSGPG